MIARLARDPTLSGVFGSEPHSKHNVAALISFLYQSPNQRCASTSASDTQRSRVPSPEDFYVTVKLTATSSSEWARKKFWSGEHLQGGHYLDDTEDADIITAMGWISTQWPVGLDPMAARTAPAISVEASLMD